MNNNKLEKAFWLKYNKRSKKIFWLAILNGKKRK